MALKVGELYAELRLNDKQFQSSLKNAKKNFQDLGNKLGNIGRGLTAAVTLPLAGIGIAATKMAMDAVESENLFKESMGGMANAARTWSEELSEALGLNAYAVRENIATFNVMLNSMGLGEKAAFDMSKGMTQLAYDMASFYNLKPEEAFMKLQAGITGEIEPLKRLGILINENTIKQVAYNSGLVDSGAKLTEQQKVLARYIAIMDQTSKAQGDMARTLDSPTNQMRIMKEQVVQLGIELGVALLPVVQRLIKISMPFVEGLKQILVWFKKLSPAIQSVIMVLTGVTIAIPPLLVGIGMITTAFTTLNVATGGIILALGALLTAIIYLAANWKKIWSRMKLTFEFWAFQIRSLLNQLGIWFNVAFNKIKNIVFNALKWIIDKIEPFARFLPDTMRNAFSEMKNTVAQNADEAARKVEIFKNAGINAFNEYKTSLGEFKDKAIELFNQNKKTTESFNAQTEKINTSYKPSLDIAKEATKSLADAQTNLGSKVKDTTDNIKEQIEDLGKIYTEAGKIFKVIEYNGKKANVQIGSTGGGGGGGGKSLEEEAMDRGYTHDELWGDDPPTYGEVFGHAKGGVYKKPTTLLAQFAEKPGARPEIVSPIPLMAETFRNVLKNALPNNNNGSVNITVQLDGRTIARGTAPHIARELKIQGV